MSRHKNRHLKSEHKQQASKNAVGNQQASPKSQPADYPLVPLTNAVKELKETYTAAQTNEREQQRKQLIVQILLCIFTFGAFGAAGWYAYITNGQWRDLRHNFQITEQAQISATKADVHEEADSGNMLVTVTLANSGHLASKGTVTRITLLRRPNQTAPEAGPRHEYFGGDETSIAPGTEWKLVFRRKGFTKEEREFAKEGHTVLALGGVIYYGNGFGTTRQSGFCFNGSPEPEIRLFPCDESSPEALRKMIGTTHAEGAGAALYDQYEERYYREQGRPRPRLAPLPQPVTPPIQ